MCGFKSRQGYKRDTLRMLDTNIPEPHPDAWIELSIRTDSGAMYGGWMPLDSYNALAASASNVRQSVVLFDGNGKQTLALNIASAKIEAFVEHQVCGMLAGEPAANR